MNRTEVPTTSRTVPTLTDWKLEDAEAALDKLDLRVRTVEESSATIDEGHVIRTNPVADVTVEKGETITLYVSTGADLVKVPVLAGLTQDAATKALKDAGLTVGTVRQQNDKSTAAGIVLSASEDADTSVEPGTTVNLVIASGNVTLDDVTGWTLDAATKKLEDLSLTVTPVKLDDCKVCDRTAEERREGSGALAEEHDEAADQDDQPDRHARVLQPPVACRGGGGGADQHEGRPHEVPCRRLRLRRLLPLVTAHDPLLSMDAPVRRRCETPDSPPV